MKIRPLTQLHLTIYVPSLLLAAPKTNVTVEGNQFQTNAAHLRRPHVAG